MPKGKQQKVGLVRMGVLAGVVLLVGGVYVLKKAADSPPASDKTVETAPTVEKSIAEDLHVTAPINFDLLRAAGVPVIIDFGADSCQPCKEMAPVLVELFKSLKGKAIIRFVDVWKYKNLAEGVPLRVIPTQVLFDSRGKPFTPPPSLGIEFILYRRRDTNEHVFTVHEGGLDKAQMLEILSAMGMKE